MIVIWLLNWFLSKSHMNGSNLSLFSNYPIVYIDYQFLTVVIDEWCLYFPQKSLVELQVMEITLSSKKIRGISLIHILFFLRPLSLFLLNIFFLNTAMIRALVMGFKIRSPWTRRSIKWWQVICVISDV